MLKQLLKNKIMIYLASRYGTYALQFIISLVIAAKLGPYYMGVYGLILLILSYFSQVHFGIANSLNILLVYHKNEEEKYVTYVWNSLILVSALGACIVLLFIYYWIFGIDYIARLSIDKYLPYICIIAVLEHFDGIFVNILRVKNHIALLTIIQSLNVLCNTIAVIFFDGEPLVLILVLSLLLSNFLKAVVSISSKIIPSFNIQQCDWSIQHEILKKGFYLFIYNSCLIFVLIVVKTLVSNNYTLEQFGYFSFSFTIANAVMLLLNSLSFIIFPKLIDILSSPDKYKIRKYIDLIKDLYVSTAYFFIFIAMIFFPVLLYLMPQYKNSLISMNLIALTVLMSTNTFGYSSLLLAQNKEKTAAFLSLCTMLISLVVGMFFVKILRVEFDYVILSTMITYFIYYITSTIAGESLLGNHSIKAILVGAFPMRLFLPFAVALFVSIFSFEKYIFIPLLLYLLLNVSTIKTLYSYILKLINNPDLTNIQE